MPRLISTPLASPALASPALVAMLLLAGLLACWPGSLQAEETATEDTAPDNTAPEATAMPAETALAAEPPRLPAPPGGVALPAPHRVWIDKKARRVYVDGYVSLREGMLEMFACPAGTKEHESVVALHSSAQMVHTALLAVGAKSGHPVQWDPEFKPPTGSEIAIEVSWQDADQQWQSAPAQQWILDLNTRQPLAHPWVFAGSGFWKDEATGQEHYLGESGDLICVSNFSSATLDLPVESSQINEGLLFEANTPRIPPVGTPVRLRLQPQFPARPAKPPTP
jgi:hypothetical protein